MKRTAIRMARYEDGNFWVDVIETKDPVGVEAWLTHKNYDVSEFMFSLYADQPNGEHYSYDGLISIIEANLPKYEASYLKEWCE